MIEGLHTVLDLETAEAGELFARPDFIRVGGYSTGSATAIRQTTDVAELMTAVELSEVVIGHNLLGFDLIALAQHAGLDIWELVSRNGVVDTMITAFLADPPPARMSGGQVDKYYSLDSVGERLVGAHKLGDLKKLAKAHGGYDKIPIDLPEFVAYLNQDVMLTDLVYTVLAETGSIGPYVMREHQVAGIAASITLNGFKVDTSLLATRVAEVESNRERLIERLVSEYGLPMLRKDGKDSTAPQNTQEGREAIKRAFEAAGAPFMPKTPKGAWATGAEAMRSMIDYYADNPAVIELAEVVAALNGQRTVYETTRDNLVGDRVHPRVALRQSSGRWSITKPGLTVMGKRGGRHVEREIFVPDEGQTMVCIDLAQIDARAVAVLSQDEAYMEMFAEGMDLHSEIALRVFGDRGMREPAKVAGHGWNYGLGLDGLINQLGIERKVAVEFNKSMREQFPRLVEWKQETAETAKGGELLDNGFGRKMRPDVARAYTQGPALMGQGCARDLFMAGLLNLASTHPEILSLLRGVVHDEVVLSVPSGDVDEVEKIVVDALSFDWAPPGIPNARPISVVADISGRSVRSWGAVYAKPSKVAPKASPAPAVSAPVAIDVVEESEPSDDDDFW